MLKLLFICKDRSSYDYGGYQDLDGIDKRKGSYGLINSCKLVDKAISKENEIECKVITVLDSNAIDREVHLYRPTHVFIEALWVTPAKFLELLPLHPSVKWAIRIHSKTPFLSNEGIAFSWINEYIEISKKFDNFWVSGNDEEFTLDMNQAYGDYFKYLPNLYPVDLKFHFHQHNDHNHVNVGCFGAIRPMKNQMEQAVAAVLFANELGKKLKFHMNGRVEQRGDNVLRNIEAFLIGAGHELVLHGWHTHEDFLELVKTMDLGMQVSFSESFNIVAADFVSQDIPIIGSEDIAWLNPMFMSSTTNASDIKNKMKKAYQWRNINLQYLNKLSLHRYNELAQDAWNSYLGISRLHAIKHNHRHR